MGCCTTNEQNCQPQFSGIVLYQTDVNQKGNKITGNRTTNPSDHTYTEKGTSQIGSQVQIKPQNLSQTHRGKSNIKQNDEEGVSIAQTWPTLQTQAAQNQRIENINKEAQNKPLPKTVTFYQPQPTQHGIRIMNMSQNAQLRIRFGPLTTIHQQESQLGQTVKLSDLGSKAELNNACRSNIHE